VPTTFLFGARRRVVRGVGSRADGQCRRKEGGLEREAGNRREDKSERR